MRLKDWLLLCAALLAGGLLFVLWTEYAYQRGVDAATIECYEDAGQVN